ncbi:MAG: hypothetical protein ACRDQZ_01850 [Mycobacteriales bacterium]
MRRMPCEFPGCDRNVTLPSEADRPHDTDLALCLDHGQLLRHDANGFRSQWDAAATQGRPAP